MPPNAHLLWDICVSSSFHKCYFKPGCNATTKLPLIASKCSSVTKPFKVCCHCFYDIWLFLPKTYRSLQEIQQWCQSDGVPGKCSLQWRCTSSQFIGGGLRCPGRYTHKEARNQDWTEGEGNPQCGFNWGLLRSYRELWGWDCRVAPHRGKRAGPL